MHEYKILWADDEIDHLKAHILFLEEKGYSLTPVNSGVEALDLVKEQNFDVVFLDESMPGMTGLETLDEIKKIRPTLPAIMITKNEAEYIMNEAIGAQISDYLIKPINPNQILLSLKKTLENKRLVSETTNQKYQQEFAKISMAYNDHLDYTEWVDIYKKLVFHELEIEKTQEKSMKEVLEMQKSEANLNFSKFIKENYEDWINDQEDSPILSHNLLKEKLLPQVKSGEPYFLIVIDNMRLDQWKLFEPVINEYFRVEDESFYYSSLPTTTHYARNSIFSGLKPLEMATKHPEFWVGEDEDEGRNNFEKEWLDLQLKRNHINTKFNYHKVLNADYGKSLVEKFNNLKQAPLNVIVYNFVDMLSHARTDMQMIKELANDDAAYRSLSLSWFQHSSLLEMIKKVSEAGIKLAITTDHGTIKVKDPIKIVGDRNTNSNLRYKTGRNINYDEKSVFTVKDPEKIFLPKVDLTTSYAFAVEDQFFVYPNNYNQFANHFSDTFQHGGISMEEVIIPYIDLIPRS